MRILLLSTIIVFYSSFIWADKYTIQVGAYHEVPEQTRSSVALYGVYHQEKKGHLTRLTLGSFDSIDHAKTVLSEIKVTYPKAFVRLIDQQHGVGKHYSGEGKSDHRHPHFNDKEIRKWKSLSEDQREHAVYLDGKLHLKYGDHFTPVE